MKLSTVPGLPGAGNQRAQASALGEFLTSHEDKCANNQDSNMEGGMHMA